MRSNFRFNIVIVVFVDLLMRIVSVDKGLIVLQVLRRVITQSVKYQVFLNPVEGIIEIF